MRGLLRGTRRRDGWLLLAIVVAGVAACGPGAGEATSPGPRTPGTSTAAPSGIASSAPAASGVNGPDGGPSSSSTSATHPDVPPTLVMKPIVASAMEAKLMEMGLDPKALPPLKKLPPDKLTGVMNTFTKALGVKCGHCHEKDFRAPTANKTIATHMWNDFTRALTMESGTLYCDSCHQGRAQLLDRHDPKALGLWMQASFVDQVKRVDGKDHSCATCHGEAFEGKIFARLWK